MSRPRLSDIITVAARLANTPEAEITGARKFTSLCAIRYAIYTTAREWFYSYPEIGRVVGDRDHSSVMAVLKAQPRLALQFPQLTEFCAEVSRWADQLPPFVAESGWAPDRTFNLAVDPQARRDRDRENAKRAAARRERIKAKHAPVPAPAVAAPAPQVALEDVCAPDASTRRAHAALKRSSDNFLAALRKAA